MGFEQGTSAIFDIDFACFPFVHLAGEIHEPDGLDCLENPSSHRSRIHAQGAADTSWNPLQKFQPGNGISPRLDGNGF